MGVIGEMRTSLFPWQCAAADKLTAIRVGALFMEQGTGKTRTALEILARRNARVDRVVWLTPCSIVESTRREIEKHCAFDRELLRLCGIESLSSSTRLYDELCSFIGDGTRCYLIVDESSLVKNPMAIRTRNITRLAAKCRYRMILNGTPVSRSMADLFAQWYLLDWRILGYRSYYAFAANHLEFDPKRPGRIVRALNTDYIAEKIAPYCVQVTRAECMQLPSKVYSTEWVAMTPEQEEHYFKVADEMLMDVDELQPETIYRMFSALQAVVSGCRVVDHGRHFETFPMFEQPEDNPRFRALMAMLDDLAGEKCIIYAKYQHEIDAICGKLGARAVMLSGQVPQKRRQQSVDAFRGSCQFLVANKACAGFGLNLQFARNVIYYSNDWNLATRIQSEDRVHRIGQEQTVQIWDIVSDGTIDERILNCLRRKEDMLTALRRDISEATDAKAAIRRWIGGEKHGC